MGPGTVAVVENDIHPTLVMSGQAAEKNKENRFIKPTAGLPSNTAGLSEQRGGAGHMPSDFF